MVLICILKRIWRTFTQQLSNLPLRISPRFLTKQNCQICDLKNYLMKNLVWSQSDRNLAKSLLCCRHQLNRRDWSNTDSKNPRSIFNLYSQKQSIPRYCRQASERFNDSLVQCHSGGKGANKILVKETKKFNIILSKALNKQLCRYRLISEYIGQTQRYNDCPQFNSTWISKCKIAHTKIIDHNKK